MRRKTGSPRGHEAIVGLYPLRPSAPFVPEALSRRSTTTASTTASPFVLVHVFTRCDSKAGRLTSTARQEHRVSHRQATTGTCCTVAVALRLFQRSQQGHFGAKIAGDVLSACSVGMSMMDDTDFHQDAVTLARMSVEAKTFEEKALLLRMALLVRREAIVEDQRQQRMSNQQCRALE